MGASRRDLHHRQGRAQLRHRAHSHSYTERHIKAWPNTKASSESEVASRSASSSDTGTDSNIAAPHASASAIGQSYIDVGETEVCEVVSDGVWATARCGVSRCYLSASGRCIALRHAETYRCSRHFLCNAAQSFGEEWETVCFPETENEDHKPKTRKKIIL